MDGGTDTRRPIGILYIRDQWEKGLGRMDG
jgi:hypothetical protein